MNTRHFKVYSREDLSTLTRLRRFETKLGERVQVLANATDIAASLKNLSARYVVIGIPEDIGIQADYGMAGSSSVWNPFLQSFLNIQSNDFFSGEDTAVIGHFDFSDLQLLIDKNAGSEEEKIAAYRHATAAIDDEVESLVKAVVAADKLPVLIGGGHNNTYPIIRGAAKGLHQLQEVALPQLHCINLDAHTGYRPSEGRHSGNPFRYAEEDGFLLKYCAIGTHENYIPQNVWLDIVNNPFLDMITYEDIFIHEKRTFRQAVTHAIEFTEDSFTGIELDLDCVQDVLSSAITPTGINPLLARQYINLCAAHTKAAYLHICEGATYLSSGRHNEDTGKLISYLVTDFIKMSD